MTQQKVKGNQGEDFAEEYLKAQGYQILARNWHCQSGEIDIVAQKDVVGAPVVFCEVKSRYGRQDGILSAITPRKQQRLIKSAQIYAHQHDIDYWQIDAIAVRLKSNGQHEVEHVEDALDW
jgi:putative endonuclease